MEPTATANVNTSATTRVTEISQPNNVTYRSSDTREPAAKYVVQLHKPSVRTATN